MDTLHTLVQLERNGRTIGSNRRRTNRSSLGLSLWLRLRHVLDEFEHLDRFQPVTLTLHRWVHDDLRDCLATLTNQLRKWLIVSIKDNRRLELDQLLLDQLLSRTAEGDESEAIPSAGLQARTGRSQFSLTRFIQLNADDVVIELVGPCQEGLTDDANEIVVAIAEIPFASE
jgi:hypothetical protein